MSLANRLSMFFLVALALVLTGFSLTLYVIVHVHLHAQLDERLRSAMGSLITAVEVHSNDVQWEPLERHILIGEGVGVDQPFWAIQDLSGRLKDQSPNLVQETSRGESSSNFGWLVLVRRMRAGDVEAEKVGSMENAERVTELGGTPLFGQTTSELPNDRTFTSDGLTITVAISDAPVVMALRQLRFTLVVVSGSIWLVAALSGRWFCRRALWPIHQMAASARSIRREAALTKNLDVLPTTDELEDLGHAFNELLTDLRESLDRQRRFAGDASHQLRTPLTAMLAAVEVVLRQQRTSEEYQRVLNVVQRRGNQLRNIIESLLFLARPEDDTLLGSPEQIDVADWCNSWLEAWGDHTRSSDFQYQAGPTPAIATTYPALLGQVLDNLLDNACQYSEPGTPINVSVDTTPKGICLKVADQGFGISEDQQASIFEPFFRTPEARWQGDRGTGLGLAVVKRLVEFLGATVEIISAPGKGSCFQVLLSTQQQIKETPAELLGGVGNPMASSSVSNENFEQTPTVQPR